jgi:hypothetical protein
MLRRPVGDYQSGLVSSHVRSSLLLHIASKHSIAGAFTQQITSHDNISSITLPCSFLYLLYPMSGVILHCLSLLCHNVLTVFDKDIAASVQEIRLREISCASNSSCFPLQVGNCKEGVRQRPTPHKLGRTASITYKPRLFHQHEAYFSSRKSPRYII